MKNVKGSPAAPSAKDKAACEAWLRDRSARRQKQEAARLVFRRNNAQRCREYYLEWKNRAEDERFEKQHVCTPPQRGPAHPSLEAMAREHLELERIERDLLGPRPIIAICTLITQLR